MSGANISLIALIGVALCCAAVPDSHAQNLDFRHDCPRAVSLFRQDTLTLRFFGDMMMHSAQISHAGKNGTYDFSGYFCHLKDLIEEADIAVANMEFTLAGEPYTGYPAFSAPEAYAEYLAECGFDIFLCANNHILDKGSEGASRTLDAYRELNRKHGVDYTGLAADMKDMERNCPLEIARKGIRVSFINMTYGTNLGATDKWPKVNYIGMKEMLERAFEKAQKESDVTIALPHWGNEYELVHSRQQEETAAWLAEKGADVIIGTHPHVVQDTMSVCGTPVAYSLGNAVSNMSAANTQVGLMVTLRIIREENGDIRMLPMELTHLWCSRPGGLTDTYTVIPIEEYIGRRDEWLGRWEYDKMVTTYDRIRKTHYNE